MLTCSNYLPKVKYYCEYEGCPQGFKTKSALKRHYLVHGIKPYHCPYCRKHLSTSKELTEHAFTHTGGKPFVCDHEGCNKLFKKPGKLALHKKKHSILEMSESGSEEVEDAGLIGCTLDTIETVFSQIAAFQLPIFFYTKVLPIPYQLSEGAYPAFIAAKGHVFLERLWEGNIYYGKDQSLIN